MNPEILVKTIQELNEEIAKVDYKAETIDFSQTIDEDVNNILLPDELVTALCFTEDTNKYQCFNTTNGSERTEFYVDVQVREKDINITDPTGVTNLLSLNGSRVSFGGPDGLNAIQIPDNFAQSFVITEGLNPYISCDTTDSFEAVTIHKNITCAEDLTVTGDLIVNGLTTTVNAATVSIQDCVLELCKGNSADVSDGGFYVVYNDGVEKYAGLVRDASDTGKWKFVTDLTVTPDTNPVYDANLADLCVNCILSDKILVEDGSELLPTLSFANDDNTGLFVSAPDTLNIVTNGTTCMVINPVGDIALSSVTDSIDPVSGSFQTLGGIGIAKNAFIGGNLITGSSIIHHKRSVTGPSEPTLPEDHIICVDPAGPPVDVVLTNADTIPGRILIIKDMGSGSNTISTEGSQTIDGVSTQNLTAPYSSFHLFCDGFNWFTY